MAVLILDQMQIFDQQVAPARRIAEQRAHLVDCGQVELASFGSAARPVLLPSRAAMFDRCLRVHSGPFFAGTEPN
jgi:hypothetical protein